MISGVDGKLKKPRPVAILIPTFGAAEKLLVCLQSLARHAPADCRVYVADDGTPDDSVRKTCEAVQSHFPQLSTLVRNYGDVFVSSLRRRRRALEVAALPVGRKGRCE